MKNRLVTASEGLNSNILRLDMVHPLLLEQSQHARAITPEALPTDIPFIGWDVFKTQVHNSGLLHWFT